MSDSARASLRRRWRAMNGGSLFCEPLERRRLLTQIIWQNRGGDGFEIFGNEAGFARNVVDAAIASWNRVITDFNYPSPWGFTQFLLSVSMSGKNGEGASTVEGGYLGNKPWSASISINCGKAGHGEGYYIDHTPLDSSEFEGDVTSAFASAATPGGLAETNGDFYSLVAHEIGHAVGFNTRLPFNSAVTFWDTMIPDTVDRPAVGYYWTYPGLNVQHLFTSYNSGNGGGDLVAPIHTAPAGASITWDGTTYVGGLDLMNPTYGYGERTLIPDNLVRVLAEALGYTTVLPSQFGTFYAVQNADTGALLIRGGTGVSKDHISIGRTGSQIDVAVDIGNDPPGSGNLPGAGDLGTFVSQFDAGSITSITVEAGDGDDTIRIDGDLGDVGSLTINAGGGNDSISVGHDLGTSSMLTIDAGPGDDSITVGDGDLAGLAGHTAVSGGGGVDTLYVGDSSAGAQSYAVEAWGITRGGAGAVELTDLATVYLASGSDSAINIYANPAGTSLRLVTAGTSTVSIGSGGSVADINGPVYVSGTTQAGTLLVIDASASGPVHATFDRSVVTGLAPAAIHWDAPDVSEVRITTGPDADTLDIAGTNAALRLTTTGGDDAINIGDHGSLHHVGAPIDVSNPTAYTALAIDASQDSGAWFLLGNGQISSQAMANCSFTGGDLRSLTLSTGAGADYITIADTPSGLYPCVTTVSTGGGNDTVNVSGTSGDLYVHGESGKDVVHVGQDHSLQSIHGFVSVDNQWDYTTLNIDDSADWTPRTVTISDTAITGLAPAPIAYAGGDLSALNIAGTAAASAYAVANTPSGNAAPLTSLTGGICSDLFSIGGTTGALAVDGGGGLDDALITRNGRVGAIGGSVSIRNSPDYSYIALTIDDTADGAYRGAAINATTLTGLAPAVISWSAADISAITVNGGNGNNLWNVTDTPGGEYSGLTIHCGWGDDSVAVRATSSPLSIDGDNGLDTVTLGYTGTLQDIHSPIDVRNTGGLTLLMIDDGLDNGLRQPTISANALTGMAPAKIWWAAADLDRLYIMGSAGGNNYTITGTPQDVRTILSSGSFLDTVAVRATTGPLTIDGVAGNDSVTIGDGGSVAGIAGEITIDNSHGATTLTVDASSESTPFHVNVTALDITGLTPTAVHYGAGDLSSVHLLTGRADDTFDVAAAVPVMIDAGNGDDSATIHAPLSGDVWFSGGAPSSSPGDSLAVVGDGSGEGVYYPNGVITGNGRITVPGGLITFTGLEPVTVSGFDHFSLVTPNAADDITIDSPAPGVSRASGSSGGVPFESIAWSGVGQFTVDSAANDGCGADDSISAMGSIGGLLQLNVGLGNNTFSLSGGSADLDTGPGLGGADLAVSIGPSAALSFSSNQSLRSLALEPGARVTMPPHGGRVLRAGALTIALRGVLDMADNDLVVQGNAAAPPAAVLDAIRNWISDGRIISSALGPLTTTFAAANDLGGGRLIARDIDGVDVDGDSVVVKRTWRGDSNLNGRIDTDDYLRLDYGFLSQRGEWRYGDANGDGRIDADDYAIMDAAWHTQQTDPPRAPAAPLAAVAGPASPRTLRRSAHHRPPRRAQLKHSL